MNMYFDRRDWKDLPIKFARTSGVRKVVGSIHVMSCHGSVLFSL